MRLSRRHDHGSKTGADCPHMQGCDPDSAALSRRAKEGLGRRSNRGSRPDQGSLAAAASLCLRVRCRSAAHARLLCDSTTSSHTAREMAARHEDKMAEPKSLMQQLTGQRLTSSGQLGGPTGGRLEFVQGRTTAWSRTVIRQGQLRQAVTQPKQPTCTPQLAGSARHVGQPTGSQLTWPSDKTFRRVSNASNC